jgi:D-glucosaminate-specific PTS system IIB component
MWCKQRRFTKIVVVDDVVATDPFMMDVMRLAAPQGMGLELLTVERAAVRLSKPSGDQATTMVLLKGPKTAKALFDGGVRFRTLNVGAVGYGPGRRTVHKNIALTDEEIGILEGLAGAGVEVEFLTVPGERPRRLADIGRA